MISLLCPSQLFPFCLLTVTPSTLTLLLLCIVIQSIPLCCPPSPIFLSASCLRPKPSSTLHAEILGERREPGRQRRRACGRAWGYRRWGRGQYRRQVSSSGDDLLLTVPRHLWSFTGHRLLHRLHRVLKGRWWWLYTFYLIWSSRYRGW